MTVPAIQGLPGHLGSGPGLLRWHRIWGRGSSASVAATLHDIREKVSEAVARLSHATRLSTRSRDLLVFTAFQRAISDPLEYVSYDDVRPHLDELSNVGVTVVGTWRLSASGEGVLRTYSVDPVVG